MRLNTRSEDGGVNPQEPKCEWVMICVAPKESAVHGTYKSPDRLSSHNWVNKVVIWIRCPAVRNAACTKVGATLKGALKNGNTPPQLAFIYRQASAQSRAAAFKLHSARLRDRPMQHP